MSLNLKLCFTVCTAGNKTLGNLPSVQMLRSSLYVVNIKTSSKLQAKERYMHHSTVKQCLVSLKIGSNT